MSDRSFVSKSFWGHVVDSCAHWTLLVIIGMQLGTTWPVLANSAYPYLYAACISVYIVRAISKTRWFQPCASSRIFGGMNLDRVGEMLNVRRLDDESDEDYRKRIDEHVTLR